MGWAHWAGWITHVGHQRNVAAEAEHIWYHHQTARGKDGWPTVLCVVCERAGVGQTTSRMRQVRLFGRARVHHASSGSCCAITISAADAETS